MLKAFHGVVERGHQVASGQNPDNPFGASTVGLQLPVFKERGFDLEKELPGFFLGTVNVSIAPSKVKLLNPEHSFKQVLWTDKAAPENFSFVKCVLEMNGRKVDGFVYYPHPETKPSIHAHRYDMLEIIAPWIEGLKYGDKVSVLCRADAFEEFS